MLPEGLVRPASDVSDVPVARAKNAKNGIRPSRMLAEECMPFGQRFVRRSVYSGDLCLELEAKQKTQSQIVMTP